MNPESINNWDTNARTWRSPIRNPATDTIFWDSSDSVTTTNIPPQEVIEDISDPAELSGFRERIRAVIRNHETREAFEDIISPEPDEIESSPEVNHEEHRLVARHLDSFQRMNLHKPEDEKGKSEQDFKF